jgi:hypothetical protein
MAPAHKTVGLHIKWGSLPIPIEVPPNRPNGGGAGHKESTCSILHEIRPVGTVARLDCDSLGIDADEFEEESPVSGNG